MAYIFFWDGLLYVCSLATTFSSDKILPFSHPPPPHWLSLSFSSLALLFNCEDSRCPSFSFHPLRDIKWGSRLSESGVFGGADFHIDGPDGIYSECGRPGPALMRMCICRPSRCSGTFNHQGYLFMVAITFWSDPVETTDNVEGNGTEEPDGEQFHSHF